MRRWSFYFVLALQTFAWASATTRTFASNHAPSPHKSGEFAYQLSSMSLMVSWPEYHLFTPAGAGPLKNSLQIALKSKKIEGKKKGETKEEEEEEAYSYDRSGKGKIGSSRPSCERKCFGCNPCEAIQVPSRRNRVAVQYTNYEPEGWKCKCGPSFYTP